ncbi:metal ABC transporter substrate-binding protein [Chromobacterium subtsugae]|uniref:Metal ABC transporter substrate-binding protein n=1 Tax=Chromobacterium subtsugae TaxID=251747 RepID=A0ABS7FBG2_9NEIS|nr:MULTISPECIES: metal ABC transporter substrate-binding protein [Chromobacterium]KUM03231.1 metal ABC transporter substrate-binding protein [Chromobacterium subtsugae]KZE85174.1 metal ABC transporter substrate-binding protein [Chromobacterium sp. F49]MBW7569077.1 metal ABC transporter substrate-binding protein [Chromobacterium subtsugae]MBW8287420.1 metal ABC transporter substrate-binding protein [Chromobacterium subtsugae]WSE93379.1 metal ABC transporter substrate-binding protein [Chromobact
MKKLFGALLLLGMPAFALAKVPVVASFSIIADMTREIGGDRVEVVSLVGPDQDAHVFQPSPADIKKVSAAKVLVVNGLGLEGWMSRLDKAANFRGVTVVASKGIQTRQAPEEEHAEGEHDHDHGDVDPHAWHDPSRVQTYIKNISAGLIQADPAGKAEYQRRAADYAAKVQALDDWAKKQFATVPAAKRKMLTSHDAFGYMGEHYQLKVLAIQGVSTESEASAKGVAQLTRQVRKEKVTAVFMENMSDKRLLQQLSNEAKVKIGGQLYADALSGPKGPAASYLQLVRYNVDTIMKSFR